MIDKNNTFMNNFKKYRKYSGLSQDELAEKTGISKRMISYYENKAINPPMDKIKIIAKVLNIKVSDLLNEDNSTNNKFIKIDSRITKRIMEIKSLPVREQLSIWKYIDYVVSNNKKQKQHADSKK
jgi:transcriptional regulator with XRE-family HTH domain